LSRVPLGSVSARGVDKLYAALQKGTKVERRLRQANLCIIRMARAWDAVQRLYPAVVPHTNPFRGVELEHGKSTTRPASRAAAYALHEALVAAGELHLAAAPLICFEWHQRRRMFLRGTSRGPTTVRPMAQMLSVSFTTKRTRLFGCPLPTSAGRCSPS